MVFIFLSLLDQRVTGSQLFLRLQYFGQSLSGGQDLTQDGLVDLAVGAQGHVLLLRWEVTHLPPLPTPSTVLTLSQRHVFTIVYIPRSLPLLKVGISIRFAPSEVAKTVYQCWGRTPTVLEAGEATVCLTVRKGSPDLLGECFPKRGSSITLFEASKAMLRTEQAQEHTSLNPSSIACIRPKIFSSPSSCI